MAKVNRIEQTHDSHNKALVINSTPAEYIRQKIVSGEIAKRRRYQAHITNKSSAAGAPAPSISIKYELSENFTPLAVVAASVSCAEGPMKKFFAEPPIILIANMFFSTREPLSSWNRRIGLAVCSEPPNSRFCTPATPKLSAQSKKTAPNIAANERTVRNWNAAKEASNNDTTIG